jgi:tripartite-type tricarboxylate transporter receptor subunit TctC
MKRSSRAVTAAVGVLTCLAACGAHAQTAPFYQGKQLSLIINFAPGGPTDAEGRLVIRHLLTHIAGDPTVVVRNMPGASGLIGANYLGEVAPPDGLTLGYFSGFATSALMADPALRVDVLKFAFVAAGPGITVTYIRSDVPPGLKVPADIMKAKDFWAGGMTPDGEKDIVERMQLDFLGLHYNHIAGYAGSAEARLAVQRNEIQVYAESMPTYRASIEPDFVKTGLVIPLWYDPLDDGEHFYTSQDADGIPALRYDQFLEQMKGELPKTQMWDAYRVLNAVGTSFLRVLVMPPGTPAAAVAIMQKAFAELNDDEDYKREAVATMKFIPRFLVDDKTVRLFHNTMNPDPKLRQFLKDYIAEGERLDASHK